MVPSLVMTEESGVAVAAFERGLLILETGSGLTGGLEAGSICQGETRSGRGIDEFSSHRT
jgi:hypothetical protein